MSQACRVSCDLLSFYYLCRTGNNRRNSKRWKNCVVICFHFTIFVVLETTANCPQGRRDQLWFAFILLSLSYWKQLQEGDQLSYLVVICFHFTIFVVLETTIALCAPCPPRLWFAFILLSLSYWKQHQHRGKPRRWCCDLLSFYYLCRTGNNSVRMAPCMRPVVICFHFTIFVVLETTEAVLAAREQALWFAFILLSLSYWKQRRNTHNRRARVVICFHFTIFVVLETTERKNG